MVTEENPAFLPEVDLHSFLTLLVENLFAEIRGGSTDTPQLLDFARRFSSSSRELMKRLLKGSYFTSTESYYSRPHCAISFKDLPQMPKLAKNKLTVVQAKCSTTWRAQHEHQSPTMRMRLLTLGCLTLQSFKGMLCHVTAGKTTLKSVREENFKMLKPWICLTS